MRVFCKILIFILLCSCGNDDKSFVYFSNYSATFNDLHEKHLAAAQKWGIPPQYSSAKLDENSKLEEIESCGDYTVDKLSHSYPYLVPRAVELLEIIGENFRDSLDSKGLPDYRIIVTSVLRTDSSVGKLRGKNQNASSNSTHRYGTTFDIAYARYEKLGWSETTRDKLKTILAQVLNDLRKQKRCYVLYEVKQGCFHVTTR